LLPYREFELDITESVFGWEFVAGRLTATARTVGGGLPPGADELCRADLHYAVSWESENVAHDITQFDLIYGIAPNLPDGWAYNSYDPMPGWKATDTYILRSWNSGAGTPFVNRHQENLMFEGIIIYGANFVPHQPDAGGEYIYFNLGSCSLISYMFNPVVNSISAPCAYPSRPVAMVLIGLGFDQSDTEIDAGPAPAKPASWDSYVTHIDFIGQEGQAMVTLTLAATDFTLDSDSQITIPEGKFPHLSKGTYHIRLRKTAIDTDSGYAESYAGDWVCDADGKCEASSKILFLVGDCEGLKKHSLPLMCFTWKSKLPGSILEDIFLDEFADGPLRDSVWVDDPNNGTITEAGGVLTLAVLVTVNGNFWGGVENAPIVIMNPGDNEITVIAKLNSYTVNDETASGIYITDVVDGNSGYAIERSRSGATNGIVVVEMGVGQLDYAAVTTLPIWLRIRASGSGAGSTIYFDYSTDGETWVTLYTLNDATWVRVGLYAKDWDGFRAISAPYEYFRVYRWGETFQDCVSPIDTRAPTVFYEGRIKRLSSLKRSIDDRTGLFNIADMNVTLANADKKYSSYLARYIIKNQIVKLWHQWTFEPEAWKRHVITMIVEDCSLKGTELNIKMKDITQKYFRKSVPAEICTEEDFPDIHPDFVGEYMPEVLGEASLTEGEDKGAVQAIYTDTANWEYLAAAGLLTLVTEVYSDGDLKETPADYSIVYRGGRTYILFTGDQEDKTVTYNAQGYSYAPWNSGDGYVQNPSYVMLYYLRFLMDIPVSMLNYASFDDLAATYVTMGEGTSGKLIIQYSQDAMEILRQLLFTFGAKGFPAMDGKFKVERKDYYSFALPSLESHIFDQITLLDSPNRKFNLMGAINEVKAQFDYFPWLNFFARVLGEERDNQYDDISEDHIPIRRPRRRGPWRI